MTTPRILMCPPDNFGIEYEINPWMDVRRQVDRVRAIEQWQALRAILAGLGVEIVELAPVAGLPDLVFTANAGLVHERRVILSRFRHPQRQGEEAHDAAWFEQHGFAVETLPSGMYFEGAGDALFCGDTLFAGYRVRSDARSHQEVGRMLGCRVIPAELVDHHFYHLDTCFCPLAPGVAIYFPGALDDYGRRVFRELVPRLVEVELSEARSFACNAVVVGTTVVTNTGCPGLHRALDELGFRGIETPLDEFVKAGGSAKCLTLRLDGEEAAAWKQP